MGLYDDFLGGGLYSPAMALGAGLLTQAGPSRTPTSFGRGLGIGVQNAIGMRQANMQQKLGQERLQQLQQLRQQQSRQGEAYRGLLDRMGGGGLPAVLGAMSPEQGLPFLAKQMTTPPTEPEMKKAADDRWRYTTGPNKGKLVFPDVEPAQQPGVFEGTGMDQQAWNKIIDYNEKLQAGLTPSPRDTMAYKAAVSRLETPRTMVTPDGQFATVRPTLPEGFVRPGGQARDAGTTDAGGMRVTPLGSRKPKSTTEAAAIANARIAEQDLAIVKQRLFSGLDERGNLTAQSTIDKSVLMSAAVPGGGLPGSEGRDVRQAVRRVIETLLRARSGAEVPPPEIDNYMDLYMPSLLDGDEAARTKVQRLEQFFRDQMSLLEKGETGADLDTLREQRPALPKQEGYVPPKPIRDMALDELTALPASEMSAEQLREAARRFEALGAR